MLDQFGLHTWEKAHSKPSLAIFSLDGIGVAEPVAVPSPKSSGIMHPDGINTIDFHV
jgi:hypothetical protein